jgi:serpin B
MKKNALCSIIALLAAVMLLSSCELTTDNLPTEPVTIPLSTEQLQLVQSENDFAFDLFNLIVESADKQENLVISPLSVSYAVAMLSNGAAGTTLDGILEAMRVTGIDIGSLNASYSDLTKALLSIDKRVAMNIANSVWIENMFTPKNPFIKALTDYYDAETHNFSITDPTVPDIINAWIEDKTNGIIKEMIDELEDNTVMLLINAIYLKARWKYEFDKSDTRDRPFNISSEEQVSVPVMYNKNKFKALSANGFLVAEMPYGQGNYVMNVILPPEDVEGKCTITRAQFDTWMAGLSMKEAEIYMPRFKFGYKSGLNPHLTDMGMGTAFNPGFADFSNISDLDLYVDEVLHQAHIETNEEGTEAAAAIAISIGVTSMPDIFILNLNRPFFFVIREIQTSSIIFMGRVSDPS